MKNRRKIKIKFVDFWQTFVPEESIFYKVLKDKYEIEICDDADYVFYSCFGEDHWAVPDNCIKIFYTGECVCPDFNACDYAIGFDWLEYGDRYLRFPLFLRYPDESQLLLCNAKHLLPSDWNLETEKTGFCSFTVSNDFNQYRNSVFQELSKYKIVDSGGRYLNNVGGPVKDKMAFDSSHKFSICFENVAYPGYTTEKIMQAFAARTVPIYWGDPLVTEYFNERAFINANNFQNIEDLVSYIEKIDTNDELYMQMLKEPAFDLKRYSFLEHQSLLKPFLEHIMDQPLVKAQRRNRNFWGRKYINTQSRRFYLSQIENLLGKSRNGRLVKRYIRFLLS